MKISEEIKDNFSDPYDQETLMCYLLLHQKIYGGREKLSKKAIETLLEGMKACEEMLIGMK